MKTIMFDIIKKNRVYFAAKLENGHSCKLRITESSKSLELGKQELLVNDVSVRSKWGTDLIYELVAEQKNAGIVTLRHHAYNSLLVSECKKLGGRWDSDEKAWIFSDFVEEQVLALDEIWNSELVTVELTATDSCRTYHDKIDAFGYPVARATGRDSGAILYDDVALILGTATSGGSMKNWCTVIREGSVLRMKMPLKVVETFDDVGFLLKIIE